MTLLELKEEAAKYGYVVVNVLKDRIPDEDVIQIACMSTGIPVSDFLAKTKKNDVVFARYLVAAYWLNSGVYSNNEVSNLLELNHTTITYAKNIMSDNVKFFKPWQQRAIRTFHAAIDEIKLKK